MVEVRWRDRSLERRVKSCVRMLDDSNVDMRKCGGEVDREPFVHISCDSANQDVER